MRMFTLTMSLMLAWSAVPVHAAENEPNDSSLGRKPPEGALVLIAGSTLDEWVKSDGKTPASWPMTGGIICVGEGDTGGSIQTKQKFGDFQLHVEFNVPYMPSAKGQARGNSGIYLTGNHELQVLDSYGLKSQDNDCGAIYKQVVPRVNACKPPLQWQSYDVTFHKARVNDGKVTRKARLTVVQNGVTIIDDAEISPTPGAVRGVKEGDDGPLMLQDHHNAVQFRNVWIKPLEG